MTGLVPMETATARDPGVDAALAWLRRSASLEQIATVVVVVAVAGILLAAWRRSRTGTPRALAPRREGWLALALVVVAAAAVRLAFADAPWQPRWYFAESTVLAAADTLRLGDFASTWLPLLGTTQVSWVHESAVMYPVSVGFQAFLGPSNHLPLVVGAAWGVAAVILAWACGRETVSAEFGVVFAGFVAGSALQVAWSRLGGLQIGSVTHVLAVLWLAHRAGRRGSVVGAALAGVLTWASVYHYFAARVAMPLAPLAFVLGAWRGGVARWRVVAAAVAFAAAVLGAFVAVQRAGNAALWPEYPGYVGSRGESHLVDLLTSVLANVQREGWRSVTAYFWSDRVGPTLDGWHLRTSPSGGTALTWGAGSGGLCLLPLAVLGALGVVFALRHWRTDVLWLGLAVCGFALPIFSVPTARRFLVFDLAWCALAARATLSLVESRPLASLPPGVRWRLALAVPLLLGVWSAGVLAVVARPLPHAAQTRIPFAESGFGDGLTCLACAETGRRWEATMRGGALVVAFDTDVDRENLTVPAGLGLYGRIAALAAQRPDAFVDFYAALRNVDAVHPWMRRVYDARRIDLIRWLAARIDGEQPAEIVWYFAAPTQWERTLAARLQEAGGRIAVRDGLDVSLPSGRHQAALEVHTAWSDRAAAMDVLRDVVGTEADDEPPCLRLEPTARTETPFPPMLLARAGTAPEPTWVVAEWYAVAVLDDGTPPQRMTQEPIAVAGTPSGPLQVLARSGAITAIGADGSRRGPATLPTRPIGRDCAAWAGARWWVVDPVEGTLQAPGAVPPWPMPDGQWVGLAAVDDDRVALADARQRVQILDVRSGELGAPLALRVPPSRRWHFGECVPMAASPAWIATLDHLRSRIDVVGTDDGRGATVPLDRLLGTEPVYAATLHAAGDRLGLAWNTAVTTFRVARDDRCPAAAAAADARRTRGR